MQILSKVPAGGVNLSGVLPMDSVAATWTACYGVGALTRKWLRGKLFDVIAGSTTYTISAINGYPDVNRLASLMGISPTLGIKGLLISKWYDQSGNGNDAVQATTANQPAVWLVNGQVSIFFGGVLSHYAQNAVSEQFLTANFSVNTQSFSSYCVFKPYTSFVGTSNGTTTGVTSTLKFSTLLSSSLSTGYLFCYPSVFFGSAQPINSFIIDLNNFNNTPVNTPNLGNQKTVIGAFGTSSAMGISLNGQSSSTVAITAGTYTSQIIGCDSSSSGLFPDGASGRMYCMMVSSTQLTTGQQTTVNGILNRWGNIRTRTVPAKINIVIDGASYDQGQGGDACGLYGTQNGGGYGYWEMIEDQLSNYDIQWNNVAASGNTIANCTANYTGGAMNSTCFSSTATKNIIIGPNVAYGNSIGIAGRTGAQTYSDFQAWLTAVKNNSWTTIACVLFGDSGTQAAIYNGLMTSNAVANGVTLITLPIIASTPPSFSNSDGHPTILGHQSISGAIISQILPLL